MSARPTMADTAAAERAKHTPGPWWFVDAEKLANYQFKPVCIIKSGVKQVASFSWNDASPWFPTKAESKANACLIAAAPAIYEALRWFIDDIDSADTSMVDFDTNVAKARAALASAEARS